MEDSLMHKIAFNVGEETEIISSIVDQFCLQLHKALTEYNENNGDYIGEELSHQLQPQAFYHLLGFLDNFSEKYDWEKGIANEYLLRLGDRKHWLPYSHQMEGWNNEKD